MTRDFKEGLIQQIFAPFLSLEFAGRSFAALWTKQLLAPLAAHSQEELPKT